MRETYANRKRGATEFTNYVIETFRARLHGKDMLGQEEILAALKDQAPSELARVIGVAPPRITEMYKGERRLKLDEAQKLVSHYGLQEAGGLTEPVAKMAVLWVAESLGKRLQAEDPAIVDIAQDLQALSEFAATPEARRSLDQVAGFLAGRKRASPRREAPLPQ